MCNTTGMLFGAKYLRGDFVKDKDILEVGSLNVNGGLRDLIKLDQPKKFVGVDIEEGPGVDEICRVEDLLERFGKNSFDVVFTTELMEHVEDWRAAIHNLKGVCKPGGSILITTRSIGFQYHGFPHDFWRYEVEDMEKIFADCIVKEIVSDKLRPGVFVLVEKPQEFKEVNLDDIALFSILLNKRVPTISKDQKERFLQSYRRRRKIHNFGIKILGKVASITK